MNELSLEDQERISADLENRFQMWKERQVIGQLDDLGIRFIPDKSYLAHERDYGRRHNAEYHKRFPATSALMAGAAVIGGIYFIGFWVVPFVKALIQAGKQ